MLNDKLKKYHKAKTKYFNKFFFKSKYSRKRKKYRHLHLKYLNRIDDLVNKYVIKEGGTIINVSRETIWNRKHK
jgi:hypothetical protein